MLLYFLGIGTKITKHLKKFDMNFVRSYLESEFFSLHNNNVKTLFRSIIFSQVDYKHGHNHNKTQNIKNFMENSLLYKYVLLCTSLCMHMAFLLINIHEDPSYVTSTNTLNFMFPVA